MAEIALTTVVRKLGDLLGNQLLEEASLLYGVKDEVEWIERELIRMQCFLKDAEAKAKEDERVKNWIREVREVAFMAENVVDTFILQRESRGTSRRGGFRGTLMNFVSILKELKPRYKMGKEIQEIRLKIHEISESKSTYGIENLANTWEEGEISERQSLKEWRRSSPHIEDPDFVGLKEDREILEARLLQREERRCVVSITGMGGVGKTTLAKKLYNCVRNNFDCLAWIYISQEYVVVDLLRSISKKVGLPETKLMELNKGELQEKLYDFLMKEKYLIVFDDIWKTKTWDELEAAIPNGKSGSKIIITTRNRDVAVHADPRTPVHELLFLDEEESWELFLRKAFPDKEVTLGVVAAAIDPPELEGLGKEIVAKCGGLPLALVVMGGLLLKKQRKVQAWKTVLLSMNWQLAQDDNLCMKVLALSYNDLPDYIKSCFLYFGIFPEDHEISATTLINLWVAEGFIKPRGQETLEDAAEDCLDELTRRSLIQSVTRRFDGRIKSCRIHDLLRDLSISKAKEGNFLGIYENEGGPEFPSRMRRLAFHSPIISLSHCNKHIYTLICFQKPPIVDWKGLCRNFKFLVILDLPGLESSLPVEIGQLVKLKYLGLRGVIKQKLPSSISHLHNLQTLDGRRSMLELPNTILKMRQLRHLWVGIDSKIHFPEQLNDLVLEQKNNVSSLQTLSELNTDSLRLHGWNYLRNFTNLRKLRLYGNYMEKEELAGLPKCLQSLWLDKGLQTFEILVFSSYLQLHKLSLKGRLEKLPDIHEFPPHLVKLTLAYSRLEQDPMPFLERLPHLRILKLLDDSFLGQIMVCSMGGFQRLEDLELVGLRQMLVWEIAGGMQRLERLSIHSCSQLKKIPDGLKAITTLKVLDVNMPLSFNSRLSIHKVDWDKIKHIPSIITTISKSEPRLDRIPTGAFDRMEEYLPWYQRKPFDWSKVEKPCNEEQSLKPKWRKAFSRKKLRQRQ